MKKHLKRALSPCYLIVFKDFDGGAWRFTFTEKVKPIVPHLMQFLTAVELTANTFTNNSDFQGFNRTEMMAVVKFLHSRGVFKWQDEKRIQFPLDTIEVHAMMVTTQEVPLKDLGIKSW